MKALLPMMEAYMRGETVEYRWADRSRYNDDWFVVTDSASWQGCFEYRIKPKLLEVWVVMSGDSVAGSFAKRENAEAFYRSGYFPLCKPRIVKMREVDEVGQ